MNDTVFEHGFNGRNPACRDKRFETLKGLLPYLQEDMKLKHIILMLLWEEYRYEHPDDRYSQTRFRYHYNQYKKEGIII